MIVAEANMTRSISTGDVRQGLGAILNRVMLRREQFVIHRKGKPLAAMVPVEKLEQLERLSREQLLQVLEHNRGKALSQAHADSLANIAKHQTRARKPKGSRHR